MRILEYFKKARKQKLSETQFNPAEFIPVKVTDLGYCLNRRLVFAPPGTGKNLFYLNPIAAAYMGKVILITASDYQQKHFFPLNYFQNYKPNELDLLEGFVKIRVTMDNKLSEDLHKQHLEKILSFIKQQPEEVLIIIDEAMAVFREYLTDFIQQAPGNCIIILESIYQLPEFFIERKEEPLEILKNGNWNIVSLENGPHNPMWYAIDKDFDVKGIPYLHFRLS